MKITHCLLASAILAAPATAQPARDVFDAQQMVRAQERGAPLDRELRTMFAAARKILDDARVGPPLSDITAIRERLHHNFIHPLQRRAMQTVGQLDTIIRMHVESPLRRLGAG